MRWRCLLGWHDWVVELRGILHEGLVEPMRFRMCKPCGRRQREIYDDKTGTAVWIPEPAKPGNLTMSVKQ